jgi:hypothetical protein
VPGSGRVPVTARTPGVPRKPSAIPWLPSFPGDAKAARKLIGGSVTFKMGELGGKGVWWILYPPTYGVNAGPGVGEGKAVWVNESPPTGVRLESGPESAYKTIQAMGGAVPGDISGSIGFSGYAISHGSNIRFGRKTAKPRLSR